MKKYIIGLAAIVLVLAISAFTKRANNFTSQLFAYNAALYGIDKDAVEDPSHWVAVSSQSCASEQNADVERACSILVSDNQYYHFDDDEGAMVLNTSVPFKMTIATEITNISPQVARVVLAGTSGVAVQTDISNKLIDVVP
jgi:hypothetical protein